MLRGKGKSGETPFEADDRYMGAGFAPRVFALVPGLILGIVAAFDIDAHRKQRPSGENQLKGTAE